MSCHPLNLGKFAQRGANMYICPMPSSLRSFYHSQSRSETRGRVAHKAEGLKGSEKPLPRKVIGVKKTLVNQMQGMVRTSDSSQLPPYKIYGKTRLFSSTSSLQSHSGSTSARRWMSSGLSSKKKQQQPPQQWVEDSKTEPYSRHNGTTLSATQRRYNQSLSFGRGLATQAARDISRSIQEELMVVNEETREMLNCNPNRHDKRSPQEQAAYDPMQGWNHPRPYKPMSGGHDGLPEELDARQSRPRRRQLVMGHASHSANVAARNRETLAKPSCPQLFNPKARVGQMSKTYSTNAQERHTELRPPPGRFMPKTTEERDSNDGLLDVGLARAMRTTEVPKVTRGNPRAEEDEEVSDSQYEQPLAEREFLKRAFLSGTGGSRSAGQSRMDELHYETSAGVGSNEALISASRQVINRKFAGLQHLTGAQKWRAPHLVESVNPTPQLNSRPVAEARGSVLKQSGKRRSSTAKTSTSQRVATPNFYGGLGESDKPIPRETGERMKDDDDDVHDDESGNRRKVQEAPRDVEPKPSRGNASGPQRHRSMFQVSDFGRRQAEMKLRGKNAAVLGRMATTKGEKRDHRVAKRQDLEPENDLTMPLVYEKKSAIQRLVPSIPVQYGKRAYNSY